VLDLVKFFELWKKGPQGDLNVPGYRGWPETGIAWIGDFSGIQYFVFRPLHGTGGAVRRLRARSFRVSAYTELIARWCEQELNGRQVDLFYSAGGRFLLRTEFFPEWESVVRELRSRIERWAWQNFEGELSFHLAAAPFSSGKLPNLELKMALESCKLQPMASVLCAHQWRRADFVRRATPDDGRCVSCGMTKAVHQNDENQSLCDDCRSDQELGGELVGIKFVRVTSGEHSGINALGVGMAFHEKVDSEVPGEWLSLESSIPGRNAWPLLRHAPSDRYGLLDFDQIALQAPRQWLAYLRIDVDHAGRRLEECEGDPLKTWALSQLLNQFFTVHTNALIRSTFPMLYAVYGGGDDLFVLGSWTDVLDFAVRLRQELESMVGKNLTFSAGVSLAKPREHILTQAGLAAEELKSAKSHAGYGQNCGRNQIRAFGVTADWSTFARLLSVAKQVALWLKEGDLPASFLFRLMQLHGDWRRARSRVGKHAAATVRYRPLLYYQISRNLKNGAACDWAHSLLQASSDWPWVDFIAKYARLSVQASLDDEV
jgi:CRISPR-associated protein Csm1